MTRLFYRALVGLHPAAFRERFGAEMLCTFEDATRTENPLPLTWDAWVSLWRQWLLRENVWKYPAAICGAALMVVTGMRLPVPLPAHHYAHPETASVEFFLMAAMAALIAVSLTTVFCVYWFRFATRRRAK